MSKPIIGIGAGGHAKVLIDALERTGEYRILGLIGVREELDGAGVLGVPLLGGDEQLPDLYKQGVRHAFIAVASVTDTPHNKRLFDFVRGLGFEVITIVHPAAIVGKGVRLGQGDRVMAGAILNPDCVLGNNVVINTAAIVEHDCRIEDHAQVAPGARLAGGVQVGEGSIVGIGATVIQGVRIGRYAVVGAGAVVLHEVPDSVTVVGIPARPLPHGVVAENV